MMQTIFSELGATYQAYAEARQEVIARSNAALNRSKRAIFALHRGNKEQAEEILAEAEDFFAQAEERFKELPALRYEGAYRAALEEYAEACLFSSYLKDRRFAKLSGRAMDPETYLAGVADACGEIVRFVTREATSGRYEEIDTAKGVVEEVVDTLMQFDLTGNLRAKLDQAKSRLRKLEQMRYDVHIHT